MSLTSGFASLASSASKVGRFVFGGDTIEETSEDEDTNEVSTGGETVGDGTSDDGDSDDGAPKEEGTNGFSAGDVSGYAATAKDGPPEGKYDDKVDVSKDLVNFIDHTDDAVRTALHVGFRTPAPVSSHSPRNRTHDHDFKHDSPVPDTRRKLDYAEQIEKLVKALTPISTPKTKSLSRSLLPKLNYTKQISVNQATFSQWVEQIKVYTYSRRWPAWCTSVGGSTSWDGVDSDSDECIARREAYEWMETSIPESSKYILIFVKKGDAKAVYEALWRRFASLTVKELQQKFWSLEMKTDEQVDHFAHVVSKAAINLSHAGVTVPDQQIASAFIQGLSRNFVMIKEKYRNLIEFSFIDVVEDATKFAIDHKILSVSVKSPSSAPHTKPLNGSVLTMCKFWRMKKGCFKKDACPLAKYHTPETKGQGWNEKSAHVVVPESKHVHAAVPSNTYLCHTCHKPGHFRKDCPVKNNVSKDKARDNAKKNASAISNLSLNFMMMSPLTANLFTTFDLKTEWIMDGGATEHLCNTESWVTSGTLKTLSTPALLTVGNGQVLKAAKSGTVHFNDVSLSDVLICEECPINIISEGKLLEKGLTITKTLKDGCLVKSGKNVIMSARMQNKLMFVDKAMLSSNLTAIRRFR